MKCSNCAREITGVVLEYCPYCGVIILKSEPDKRWGASNVENNDINRSPHCHPPVTPHQKLLFSLRNTKRRTFLIAATIFVIMASTITIVVIMKPKSGIQKPQNEHISKNKPHTKNSGSEGTPLKSPIIVSWDKFIEFNKLPKDIANKAVDFKSDFITPSGYSIDLDSDGVSEWIISVDAGSGGYSYNIYKESRAGLWMLIGGLVQTSPDFKIGLSKSNGFYDITMLNAINNSPLNEFIFNGKEYVDIHDSSKSVKYSTQVGQENATIAMPGSTSLPDVPSKQTLQEKPQKKTTKSLSEWYLTIIVDICLFIIVILIAIIVRKPVFKYLHELFEPKKHRSFVAPRQTFAMKNSKCSNCTKEITGVDLEYCPYCGVILLKSEQDQLSFAMQKDNIMDCPNCGKEVSANSKFCGGCGKKVQREVVRTKDKYKSVSVDTILKGALAFSLLVICFSVFYYFVIFIPKQKAKEIEITKQEESAKKREENANKLALLQKEQVDKDERDKKSKEIEANKDSCMEKVSTSYNNDWEYSCIRLSRPINCALPVAVAELKNKELENDRQLCMEQYRQEMQSYLK